MGGRIERLAEALAAAWRSGGRIPLPAAEEAPRSRAEAYAVQDRMAELIGGEVVGWKVGATVRAVQLFEGHDGPLPGRIFADRCFDGSGDISSRLVRGGKVECELAVRLVRDLPVSPVPMAAADLAGLLTVHPAIELAATRYAPGTGTTKAMPTSPMRSSGTPITAEAAMPGCWKSRFSTSAGYTLNPPMM